MNAARRKDVVLCAAAWQSLGDRYARAWVGAREEGERGYVTNEWMGERVGRVFVSAAAGLV